MLWRKVSHILVMAILLLGGFSAPAGAEASKVLTKTVFTESNDTTILYVDQDATGFTHDGSSWENAYVTLQDALAAASSGTQIWVAEGVYYPDEGSGQTDNNRYSTFTMAEGVALYGGFAGTEAFLDERDWESHVTVLSGDIDGNDISDPHGVVPSTVGIMGANAYHVLYSWDVSETAILDGFSITAGQADGSYPDNLGGGMYNEHSSPKLTDVTFNGNTAYHGGGMYNEHSSPELTDVTFSGNTAVGWAGGMHNYQSSPTLTDVTIFGNSAESGAGMFIYGGEPALVNVEFWNNHASINGGGLHTHNGSDATLTNVTFSGNIADSEGGGIYNLFSTITLTNTIVWGNTAPNALQIVNSNGSVAVSYSDIQGSSVYTGTGNINLDPQFLDAATGNLRLQSSSPAIDAGDNAALSPEITTDLDGSPRFSDIVSVSDTGSGDTPIVDMGAYEAQPGSDIIYVDRQAEGTLHDGSSWQTAFLTLQTALAAADTGNQIWVAQGVYTPGPAGNRAARFSLKEGVALYGGFAGDEEALSQRDWETNLTVLSGDIDGNDNTDLYGVVTSTAGILGANAYHVVFSQAVTETAILDGFHITAGRADGNYPENCGGGMNNDQSSPTLKDVTFSGNFANYGGGMYNYYSSPTLTDVIFSGNSGDFDGGGMFSTGGSPTLANVTFSGNSAGSGGGMHNLDSSPTLIDVIFFGNSAESGAGMFIYGGGPTLVNVEFLSNQASINGGGLHTYNDSDATLTNVTFFGNIADSEGGGIYNKISTLTLTNTIVWGNSAELDYPQIANDGGNVAVSYSDIQGSSVYTGTGNINLDPQFVDAAAGNLRLQSSSPAIDAGDNAALPDDVITDLDGSPRFIDIDSVPDSGNGDAPIIDMGAYEAQNNPLYLYLPLVMH